jgi:hypothetical protein
VGGDRAEIEKEAVRRISGAWANEENIDVEYSGGGTGGGGGYVQVSIRPPLVFPGLLLPMTVSARSRVVDEGSE